MGAVYKARQVRMDRVVAIKLMPSQLLDSEAAVSRFEREVRAAGKLDHPNIVTAYDAGEVDGRLFLVLQYVDGDDLASIVRQQGALSTTDALGCIRQAALGLAYAHDQGVIHRDVKPSNILLDCEGTIRILDLGLALIEKDFERATEGALTQSGVVLGTIDYMAPEQAQDTRIADARSDIYSLGCTLYFLMTGRAVYSGTSAVNRLMAHQKDRVPSLQAARNHVTPELEDLFQKMMAKEPDARFQSMSQLIEAVDAQLSVSERAIVTRPAKEKTHVDIAGFDTTVTAQKTEMLETEPTQFESNSQAANPTTRRFVWIAFGILAALFAGVLLLLLIVQKNLRNFGEGAVDVGVQSDETETTTPPDVDEDNTRIKQITDKEWVTLFDGSDLLHCEVLGDPRWEIENGVLVSYPFRTEIGGGALSTKTEFTNYELEFEFRLLDGEASQLPIVDKIGEGWSVGIASEPAFQATKNRWYRVRVTEMDQRLKMYIDDELTGEHSYGDELGTIGRISLRSYQEKVAYRRIRIRKK